MGLGKCFTQVLAVAIVAMLVSGCMFGERKPFQKVQLCLAGEEDLLKFKNILIDYASLERIVVIDYSEQSKKNLELLTRDSPNPNLSRTIINMGGIRDDGLGISAINISLSPYQVIVDFVEGSDASDSRRFSAAVIGELAKHWRVEDLPVGRGGFPMKDCNRELR